MRFWDSSALVALHVAHEHTASLRRLHSRDSAVLAWILSDVEMRSAVARLARDGVLDAADVQKAVERIESFWQGVHTVSVIEPVKLRAKRLLGAHALRAADAFQLGAALTAAYDEPLGWEFVCLDKRLGEAARREGFAVVP
ncbi:MAG: type II toxin-antitoxin system VapC family toxin [Candidatus Eiseniibacteriota bacterium]